MEFCGYLGIVQSCACLTKLCGPALTHPVKRPETYNKLSHICTCMSVSICRRFKLTSCEVEFACLVWPRGGKFLYKEGWNKKFACLLKTFLNPLYLGCRETNLIILLSINIFINLKAMYMYIEFIASVCRYLISVSQAMWAGKVMEWQNWHTFKAVVIYFFYWQLREFKSRHVDTWP